MSPANRPSPPVLSFARVLALALAIPVALIALAPWLRVPLVLSALIAFALTAGTITLTASGAQHLAPMRLPRLLLVALSAVVLGAASYALGRRAGEGALGLVSAVGASAAVLAFASPLGVAVGRRIERAGHLLAVALASSAADLWSVSSPSGVTHKVIHSRDEAFIRMLAVNMPVVPMRMPMPTIGMGDVIFSVLYGTALLRAGASPRRVWASVFGGLFLAGLFVIVTRQSLPALPFLGLSVVLLHKCARDVPREDRATTAVVGVLFALVCVRVALRLSGVWA